MSVSNPASGISASRRKPESWKETNMLAFKAPPTSVPQKQFSYTMQYTACSSNICYFSEEVSKVEELCRFQLVDNNTLEQLLATAFMAEWMDRQVLHAFSDILVRYL